MPRVVITKYVYAHTNEDALRIAREARMNGCRSEIITEEEYNERYFPRQNQMDLSKWAAENSVAYVPSL